MKKISIGLLDELAKNQQRISELEMKSFVGGGSGTADDPYSITEMESLMDSFQWNGGYVEYIGYVDSSSFFYASYYGGFCSQYNGSFADHLRSLIDSGLDQLAGVILSEIPYVGNVFVYIAQEMKDCELQMLSDLSDAGYADRQINFVVTPGNYSSVTTDWSIIMSANDAKTGELLVSYKINNFGFYERIQ